MAEVPVQKFFPSPEELSSICSRVKCPQHDCKAVFQSTSNLTMHLIKHHKITHSGLTAKKTETQYFCPISACPYHEGSKKPFTKLKYLKQHFLKVHALKEFVCNKCEKKFSTETFRNLHMKNCGKLFKCTCGACYTSSEAILTHCKRKGKGHVYIGKNENEMKTLLKSEIQNHDHIIKKTERLIYPKLTSDVSFPVHYVAAIALSELSAPCTPLKSVDKGVQTELYGSDLNKNSSVKFTKKGKHSQHTQTLGKYKKMKISTQTQTHGDYLKHKNKGHPKAVLRKRKKSMETQTKDHRYDNIKMKDLNESGGIKLLTNPSHNKPVNGSDKILEVVEDKSKDLGVDEEKARKWLWEIASVGKTPESKNELFNSELNLYSKEMDLNQYNRVSTKNNKNQYGSEQTSDNQIFDLNRLCNIETQTEIDALLTECNDDTTFTLCSTTETQTTDDFDSLYSNMCTQTCEEVDQLFNFNFVHIETQTAWPDLNDCSDLDP